jgi:hypothetical protein
MECSAKERIGVDDIFDTAIELATADEMIAKGEPVGLNGGLVNPISKKKRRARQKCKIL